MIVILMLSLMIVGSLAALASILFSVSFHLVSCSITDFSLSSTFFSLARLFLSLSSYCWSAPFSLFSFFSTSHSLPSTSLSLISSCSASDKNVLKWVVNVVWAVVMSLFVALTSSSRLAVLPPIVCCAWLLVCPPHTCLDKSEFIFLAISFSFYSSTNLSFVFVCYKNDMHLKTTYGFTLLNWLTLKI